MKGIANIPARLCAICVKGAATTTTTIDGRKYQVCAEHGDVEDERERSVRGFSREAVIEAVARQPGVSATELAPQFLPETDDAAERARARSAWSVFIGRMITEGRLRVGRVGSGRQRSVRNLWVAA